MAHIEFAVLFLMLLWLMRMLSRAADGRYMKARFEEIQKRQTFIVDVLHSGWSQTLGTDKADAILWGAENPPWKGDRWARSKGNPDAK